MARIKIESLSEDQTEISDDMLDDVIGGSIAPSNALFTLMPMPALAFAGGRYNAVTQGTSSFTISFASASQFSDRRLKSGIRAIGQTRSGVQLYAYRYIWDSVERTGVMADEAPRSAVSKTASGYARVDYAQVGL